METIADIEHLSLAFKSKNQTTPAVDDVSFVLEPGKTLCLVGESGCGKSLTSHALMRLLPVNCLYGKHSRIKVDDLDILDLPETILRSMRGRRLAMIFQEPMSALNPVLSIGQQLGEALQAHQDLKGRELQERMIALLDEVEIPQPECRLHQYPHQLSGGQKQRVLIAIALAGHPEILIADEPTTALDVTIQAQILTLLKKLQVQRQMSLLLITHDMGVVKSMADRVCVMYAGQLVESALKEPFFNQPLHPYSQQLLMSIPTMAKRGQRLQAIGGSVPVLGDMPAGCRFHPRCAHVFDPCSKIEPLLQDVKQHRRVRCHLYPLHEKPPALILPVFPWTEQRHKHEVVLTVDKLAVSFKPHAQWFKPNQIAHKAVDGVSFELFKGKTLALVGESGCGKTTTAKAILRLQTITSGAIYFQNHNITTLRGRRLREYRKKVQIIFQDPFSSMNPRMTVGEIIAEGMLAQGMSRANIIKKQHQLLDNVNLAKNSLNRYPHQFSGGQRQRICIARALATNPEILVCDEPTSALDISVQAQILNLLKELQLEHGLSYLFITHNLGIVSYIADEIIVMRDGKITEKGDCKTIFEQPTQSYTQALLNSVLMI